MNVPIKASGSRIALNDIPKIISETEDIDQNWPSHSLIFFRQFLNLWVYVLALWVPEIIEYTWNTGIWGMPYSPSKDQTKVSCVVGWFHRAGRQGKPRIYMEHWNMEYAIFFCDYPMISNNIIFVDQEKLLFFQCILKQNLQVNERIIILLKLRPPTC